MYVATRLMAPSMFPDRRVRAPKTAIVITAKTTPYSAMVCPSSRDCSAVKSFCTCFTSLLVLGRQGGAADDSASTEEKEFVPAFLEPLSCWTTRKSLTPNFLSFVLWRGRAADGLNWRKSSFVESATPIPRPSDCGKAFPYSGEWPCLLPPDE